MLIFLGIIVSILVFSIIILVHEYGHFKTARMFWVKVEEFWLWIPPKAKTLWTDKHGTLYTLNWLPLGWFVRLKWESIQTFALYDAKGTLYNNQTLEDALINNESIFDADGEILDSTSKNEIFKKLKENNDSDSLMSKPAWQQAIIMLAWVFMNFLLAGIILSILFFIWISPIGINNKIETSAQLHLIPSTQEAIDMWFLIQKPGIILHPIDTSIAQISGILQNDILEKVNETVITSPTQLKDLLGTYKNTQITFSIQRALNNCDITQSQNCEFETKVIPITPNNEGKIWSYLIENSQINTNFKYDLNIFQSIWYGFQETYNQIILTFQWIKTLLQKIIIPETPTERSEAIQEVSGPIGIVNFIANSISNGIIFILIIWSIISINLWVFNLLPIPALDGWRFILITINSIIKKIFWKKAISDTLEWLLHMWFFIAIIILSIFIAYNDITKIITN